MLVQTGAQTVFNGTGLYTVAPSAAVMSPSIAPASQLGPAAQPTMNTPQGVASGVSSAVGDPTAVSNSSNPLSSHSAILIVIAGMFISVAGLHWIFYPKEKVI